MNAVCFQVLHVKREVHDSNITCLGVIWACGPISACEITLTAVCCFCHLLPNKQLRGQFNLLMQLPWIQVPTCAGLCTERKMLPLAHYCADIKTCGQCLVGWLLEGAGVMYKGVFLWVGRLKCVLPSWDAASEVSPGPNTRFYWAWREQPRLVVFVRWGGCLWPRSLGAGMAGEIKHCAASFCKSWVWTWGMWWEGISEWMDTGTDVIVHIS